MTSPLDLDLTGMTIEPSGIVFLGSSAAQALLGNAVRIMEDRGVPVSWGDYFVMPTLHPSFILRSSETGRPSELFGLLVSDLQDAAKLATNG